MVGNQSELSSLLRGCLSTINHQSSLMKQCLGEGNLLQALKHCSNFLNELRTNKLSPKQYYELYILVFDSLEYLSAQILVSHKSKQKKRSANNNGANNTTPFLADLYELVQYSGNIIPRLYMMIVIGTTYMSTNDAPTKEIMKDMIEMCRGVQHPIRGLFLRYYLSQRIKDLLPLSNEVDFNETVEFLISNFIEMNKLWVRLQHQGHSSERELRYRERKELKILVGSNLVRLSQIIDDYDGGEKYSSEQYYKDRIFPIITEQIIQCRDHLAQSYLIDVLIQIFPDNFHFQTLQPLLNDVFLNLHPLLRKSELVSTLIERFITYHKFENDLVATTDNLKLEESVDRKRDAISVKDLFHKFWDFYILLYSSDPEMSAEEHSSMLQSFIKLSLTYDPENYENLDVIYKFVTENLSKINQASQKSSQDENGHHGPSEGVDETLWLLLLIAPIQHFSSIKNLLKLTLFHEFYQKLSHKQYQKQISLEIVNKVLSNSSIYGESEPEYLTTIEEIDGIFKYLLVLIKDTDTNLNTSKNLGITKTIRIEDGEKFITEDFLTIQEKICKTIHLIEHPDVFKCLFNLMYVRKKFLNKNPENIIYTYPTLISKILMKLRIAGYINLKKKKGQDDLFITNNFKNLSIIIDELYQHHQQFNSELVLKIYLNAASVADQLQQESLAYEFFSQCFVIYEENLILNPTPKQYHNPRDTMGGSLPYQSILMIANRLNNLRYFSKESYETLITKVTLYGSKLLKKQDQCRSVYYCAHLWWWCDLFIDGVSPTVKDDEEEEQEESEDKDNADQESDKDNKSKQIPSSPPILYRDAKRVLECLQKSLRIADSCIDPYLSLKLFLEILNRCLIFNVYGNYLIDSRYINGLIDLIKTNVENLKDDNNVRNDDDQEARLFKHIEKYFDRTLTYIAEQQMNENRFADILV